MIAVAFVLLVLGPLCCIGAYLLTSALYRDGYEHGYSDGVFNTEFPEFADGPMFGGDK